MNSGGMWGIDWRAYPWRVMRYRTFNGKKYVLYQKHMQYNDTLLGSRFNEGNRKLANQDLAEIRGWGGLARITRSPQGHLMVWANPNGSREAYYTIYDGMPNKIESEDGLVWKKESGW